MISWRSLLQSTLHLLVILVVALFGMGLVSVLMLAVEHSLAAFWYAVAAALFGVAIGSLSTALRLVLVRPKERGHDAID